MHDLSEGISQLGAIGSGLQNEQTAAAMQEQLAKIAALPGGREAIKEGVWNLPVLARLAIQECLMQIPISPAPQVEGDSPNNETPVVDE